MSETTKSNTNMIDCGQGIRLRRGVGCAMSDGTLLYSDHYYPATGGPHPTLLMRQPYGRDIASTVVYAHPIWFARHGYNVVIQDVRGRGDSTGEFYPFRNEERDGVETIAWLRTLPESNGKIGMYGFSYQGMTQWLAAAARPEGLLCIAPAQTAHDLYRGWFYNHGVLRLASSLGWGLQMLKQDARRLKLREPSEELERAWSSLSTQILHTPTATHPAISAQGLPTYVTDWLSHDRPGEFWSEMDISERVREIDIPALHISGWYDTYLRGSIASFREMCDGAGLQHARDNQFLLAGPWVHIPWGDRIGTKNFGAEANLDTDALHLRWFNHWLKDSGEFSAEPRIRYFAMNEDRWHSAVAWPATNYTLYLHSEGRANSSKGDGTLTPVVPERAEPSDIFVVDPEVPVVAPGGMVSASGCYNQAALELGNNLLVYTTPSFTAALHLFGAPRVSVHVTTSAAFADLVVKLICLRANGDADFICIGTARSTYLFPEEGAVAYCADVSREWSFELEPTSWVFKPGESLRIEVAGNAYPLYERNPGTETKPSEASSWEWQRSTHTVHHDPSRPSAIHLPVLEDCL